MRTGESISKLTYYPFYTEDADIDAVVNDMNELLNQVFEKYTKKEVVRNIRCDNCTGRKRRARSNFQHDKPWITTECKELYNNYKRALMNFNTNRTEGNRMKLNLDKQKYKVLENRLKRRYKNGQGNMFSAMRKSNPKRFYRKFKQRKKVISNSIDIEQFVEHFKSLMSGNDDDNSVFL